MLIWDKNNANIPKSMWFCSLITFFQHLAIIFCTAIKDLSNLIHNNSYGDEDEERLGQLSHYFFHLFQDKNEKLPK